MPPKVHQTRGSKPSNDSEETTTTTFIKREPQSPQQNQQLQPSATPQKQNQITDVDYNPFFSPTADPTINEDNFLNSPDVANKRKRVNSKSGVVGDRFIANRIYNDPVSAYTLHNEVNRPSSTHKRKAPEPDSHRGKGYFFYSRLFLDNTIILTFYNYLLQKRKHNRTTPRSVQPSTCLAFKTNSISIPPPPPSSPTPTTEHLVEFINETITPSMDKQAVYQLHLAPVYHLADSDQLLQPLRIPIQYRKTTSP